MKLLSFEVLNFRNLSHVRVTPSNAITGFWGANGQGKTNILEALFATITGKSFRPYSKRGDWVPESFPSEHGQVSKVSLKLLSEINVELDVELSIKSHANGKLQVLLNGKPTQFSNIRSKIPIVVFSPDDHSLIRQSPEARRGFIDEIFSDVVPGYIEVLERFERTLKNRNKLLKLHQQQELRSPSAELRSFTELYTKAAFELFTIRMEIWEIFAKRFGQIASDLFKESTPDISVSFEADIFSFKSSAISHEDFRAQTEKSWFTDLATGWTHRGPHRDDIKIAIQGLDSRSKASQGQARLLALALKWTHALWVTEERGERPLFLIDDLSSELDATHRARLLDLIKELSCQVFISGTDPSLVDFASISDYIFYRVKKGQIYPL